MAAERANLSPSEFFAAVQRGPIEGFAVDNLTSSEDVELGIEASDGCFRAGDFSQWDLSRSIFRRVEFVDCRFRSARLDECRFEQCTFFDPDAERHCDFSFADLREAGFDRCDLTTALLTRSRAYGISLTKCQAQGADFSEADFSLGLPRGSGTPGMSHARFVDCNLSYADFSGTVLSGCELTDNRLVHSIWHNAVLDHANLTGSTLDNIEARGLVLRGADLRGCRFNNLDPRHIDLSGVQVELEQGLLLLTAMDIQVE